MTDLRPLDYSEARRKAHELHKRREAAIQMLEERTATAAEAERDYRKAKAQAFAQARSEEMGVTEAEVVANGAVADARFKRDLAEGMVRAQREVLEALEADRAMLRHFSSWSQVIHNEGVGG